MGRIFKKKAELRRLTQGASLFLFFYLYYRAVYPLIRPVPENIYLQLDPLAIVSSLLSLRIVTFIGIFALFALVVTLYLGRFYCGWLCPLGATLELMGRLVPRIKRYKLPDIPPRFRYYILAILLLSPFLMVQYTWVPDPLVGYTRGFSFVFKYGDYYVIYAFIAVSLFYHPRIWCRRICPLGAFSSIVARYRLVNRTIDPRKCNGCRKCVDVCLMKVTRRDLSDLDLSNCVSCMRCEDICPKDAIRFRFGDIKPKARPGTILSRRNFISAFGIGLVTLGLAEFQHKFTIPGAVIRPPGALREDQFLASCIRCEQCLRACPSQGLVMTFLEGGLAGVLTPKLDPGAGRCEMCMLCAEVCPTEALQKIGQTAMKIGTADLHRKRCMVWSQAKKCHICIDQCPVEAIEVDGQLRPFVIDEKCNGCGACENSCPVKPVAITVSARGEKRITI